MLLPSTQYIVLSIATIIFSHGKDFEQYSRPIHIGVYGHPNYQSSSFKLEVLIVEKQNEMDYFNENVVDSDLGHDGDHEGKLGRLM